MIEALPRWLAIRAGAALLLALTAQLFAAAPAMAADTAEPAMSFTLENETPAILAAHRQLDHGDRTVYAKGAIVVGTTDSLLAFIRHNHLERARIYFDSPGGDVAESMKLGEEIRSRQFNTAIGRPDDTANDESEAICASACVFAYAGGENRFMAANSGRLGIHQFSSAKRKAAIADTQLMSGMIVAYLSHMGVDPNAFALQTMVDPNTIMWLTPKQARALGFVNDGAQPSTAEIKLIDMVPVLMLTQHRYDMEMSTAVICGVGGYRINTWLHADYTDAVHMRGLGRSWFELDGQLALDQRGADAVTYDRGGITVSRGMSDETLARLLAANVLALWVENGNGDRWGSAMDLRDIHDKMAEYFTECSHIRRTASTEPSGAPATEVPRPAAPASSRATASGHVPSPRISPSRTPPVPMSASGHAELVIASRAVRPQSNALTFVDRATIARRGHLVTVTGYLATQDRGRWSFFEGSYTFECDGNHYQSAGHSIDRAGHDLGPTTTAWSTLPPGSTGEAMQRIACGRAHLEDWQLIDSTDPYEVIRAFVAAVSPAPDDNDGSNEEHGRNRRR